MTSLAVLEPARDRALGAVPKRSRGLTAGFGGSTDTGRAGFGGALVSLGEGVGDFLSLSLTAVK